MKMSKLAVLKLIFKITLKLKLHIFYAYVIYFYTRRKSKSDNEGVLIFDRVNSDLPYLMNLNKFNYLFFESKLQYRIASLFLDKEIMSQKNYFSIQNKDYENQKADFRNEIFKILKHLKRIGKIKYIIVANCNYYEHQEWANAGKDLGIELIVYSKESVLPEGRLNAFKKHFNNLSGEIKNIDKILVYGESGYNQFIDSQLVDKENIFKVGSLKTDYLYEKIKKLNDKGIQNKGKDITFFAFPCGPFPDKFDANSFYSQVWQGGYWAPNLWNDCLDLFIKLANYFPDLNFVIKTKSSDSSKMIAKQKNVNKNIIFSHDKETWEIYRDSRLIFGFNSTVLLEMITTDIPFFIPKWHEAENEELADKMILNNQSEAYNTYYSKDEMLDALKSYISDENSVKIKNSQDARRKIIEDHLYKIDGKVGKRILEILN